LHVSVTLYGLVRKQRNEYSLMWNTSPAFCKWRNASGIWMRYFRWTQVTIDKDLNPFLSANFPLLSEWFYTGSMKEYSLEMFKTRRLLTIKVQNKIKRMPGSSNGDVCVCVADRKWIKGNGAMDIASGNSDMCIIISPIVPLIMTIILLIREINARSRGITRDREP
jgi:hypothetical protein